tara:strand:- start:757 stop:1083 length:327 start_codon:yes stop_codon:yes gene_type:complete
VLSYLFGQLGSFLCQLGVPLTEHIGDQPEVPLVFDQKLIGLYLFVRHPLHDAVFEGGTATVLAEGKTALPGLDLQQFLLVDRAAELDELLLHFPIIFCDLREQKQDLS